jgi:hypothetical protein
MSKSNNGNGIKRTRSPKSTKSTNGAGGLSGNATALQLLAAVDESRNYLIEALHKTIDPSTGEPDAEDFRKDAEHFLSSVINRFETVTPESLARYHSCEVSDVLARFGTMADRTFGNAGLIRLSNY